MKPDVVHFHAFQTSKTVLSISLESIRYFIVLRFSHVIESDDVKVTVEETRNDKLSNKLFKAATTAACATYNAGAGNVAVSTGTAAVGNDTGVATGAVGRVNMSRHDVC